MKKLAKAINAGFFKAYPEAVDILGEDLDEDILVKRVNMLVDDLMCTRINFSVTNRAYADLDRDLRGIRNHWWQFWRKPSGRSFRP